MDRCKTCGKEFVTNQVMTYSVYGYCSWDCLRKMKPNNRKHNRDQRKNNGHRHHGGLRSRWA